MMKISFDLRFANLPCGGRTYVSEVIQILIREHPSTRWRVYYNEWSEPQREIVRQIKAEHRQKVDSDEIEFCSVRSGCLSLRHHVEFLRYRDDANVYHYLHFDMPLGMRKLPLVVTIHDLYPLTLPGYCSLAKRTYFYRLTRRNAHRAAQVITVSQNTKRDILEWLGVSQEKIRVIPQGYSKAFHPIEDEEKLAQVAEKYRLCRKFILYTGNHKSHKNLSRLFQAFGQLPLSLQEEYGLVLTGPLTEDTNRLRECAARVGIESKVNFLGLIANSDLPALYNLATLLVLPSLYEGFGIPLVEAMACGTTVVGSNVSAIPEVVGDVGRLFDPYSVESIAAVLTETLENEPWQEQQVHACLEQASKFSWEKTARKTYEVYQAIAG